jgi:general stress protein 26
MATATEPPVNTMTPLKGAKRWAYLGQQSSIRLASLEENGDIYLTPLWFVISDQEIYLPLDAGSRHATNSEAGRSVSALVDAGDDYSTVTGVRILGTLEAVTDDSMAERLQDLVLDKYFHLGHPFAEAYVEFGEFADRSFQRLAVTRMIGWDMRENATLAMPEARSLPDFVSDRLL